VSGEKVLKHRVQDVVLFAIEFRVFVEGKVPRAADTLYCAQHAGSLAFQCLEFFAHIFSGGREFYGLEYAEQRYFRTTLWIFRGLRRCSAESVFVFSALAASKPLRPLVTSYRIIGGSVPRSPDCSNAGFV
jgi:hypothetical protein